MAGSLISVMEIKGKIRELNKHVEKSGGNLQVSFL